MLDISIKPVMRFVARYGNDIQHYPRAAAVADRPWRLEEGSGEPVLLKGLVQRVRPGSSRALPQENFRAVAVLALQQDQARPRPGDTLSVEDQRWRILSVLPLARHRSGEMLEAILVSHGGLPDG